MEHTIYQFDATLNNGEKISLNDYNGKVLLIVNTASKCGFTPQYQGLQSLYEQYAEQGFAVLAFPCDQFGHQEPGTDDEIQTFCERNYNVTFPLFKKIQVNGDKASPLYQFVKKAAPGLMGSQGIKWNFTKFLVDQNGKVIKRFAPTTKPEDIQQSIQTLLAK